MRKFEAEYFSRTDRYILISLMFTFETCYPRPSEKRMVGRPHCILFEMQRYQIETIKQVIIICFHAMDFCKAAHVQLIALANRDHDSVLHQSRLTYGCYTTKREVRRQKYQLKVVA